METQRKRTPIVAANWKMNKTCAETVSFISKLLYELEDARGNLEVMIFPPFTALRSATTYLESEKKLNIRPFIGAQNMHWEDSGAFTGEISPLMLKELGIRHVILGHSERRNIFGETPEVILKKVEAAIRHEMTPIICAGESLEQRKKGETESVLKSQLYDVLTLLKSHEYLNFVIAYEPVWAIGTGVAAKPDEANDACRFIRALIGSLFSPEVALKTRILYGGSVDPSNFRDFLLEPDIDGGLIGSASLSPEKFLEMIRIALNYE